MAGWGVGVDGDQAKQPPFFPNLYPPLTPVPQCVAEIRAIGQSPIHCHPEYFKVKPPRLTKKVLLIKGLLSLLSLSSFLLLSVPRIYCRSSCTGLSMVQCFVFTFRRGGGREVGSCGSSPSFDISI